MSRAAPRRRGQPLAMLAVVLAGWAALRVALWQPPFPLPAIPTPGPIRVAARPPAASSAPLAASAAARVLRPARLRPAAGDAVLPLPAARQAPAAPDGPMTLARPQVLPLARPTAMPPAPVATGIAAGHQLLYLAALGRLPLPPGLAAAAAPRPAPFAAAPRPRWSGDGWLLLRGGAGARGPAAGLATYGASQAGGVVRYALRPGSGTLPQAHLRMSRALGGVADGEVAAGLSARPLAGVPIRLLGEARVQRSAGRTRLRPAAAAITELPPVRLPFGLDGEAYAQAGYVGGAAATAFFDGQAIAERRLARAGPAELRLGAGAWAGGQRGAARLDVGPRASLRFTLGDTRSRLALDWRVRVAGDARPASGPALTLATGF